MSQAGDKRDYPITPVPFTAVKVDDGFWTPRLEMNRTVTLPYDFRRCEETGRIDNFAKAGGLKSGPFEGRYYNDSDVYKVVEGAAYCLTLKPDAKLDRYLDELIAKFAAAQEPDGYLYTIRTIDPQNVQWQAGPARWSNLRYSHELYCLGHLYEAAVAHHQATGKRNLLDIALKSAELVAREFGPDRRIDPPGHQEIEIGLVKLYRLTGDERYLQLAKFFLDVRGRNHDRRPSYEEYAQDHLPVTQQDHPVGHAVRAVYMYCGMADVAALTGTPEYIRAIDRIWDNMVGKRLYITGGIGARHEGEAFGADYELPNQSAYCETCAAIANAMWNLRMFLLHGDGKYVDVLERTLYNGFLAGVALSGDLFFYVNPLASDGTHRRQPWFDCACCPTNVVRFMPSIPGYVYAQRDGDVYVNLFIGGQTRLTVSDQPVELTQQTRYPWDGAIRITVRPGRPLDFTLRVRIPGWTRGQPLSTDLYTYLDARTESISLKVNGSAAQLELERGYAVIRRAWHPGDTVELGLPMPVRRVLAHPRVQDCAGRVALERGPIVYCAEAVDNDGRVGDIVLPDSSALIPEWRADLLGGVTVLRARACRSTSPQTAVEFMAIPYYAWCHRDPGEMLVWLPRQADGQR